MKGPVVDAVGASSRHRKVSSSFLYESDFVCGILILISRCGIFGRSISSVQEHFDC